MTQHVLHPQRLESRENLGSINTVAFSPDGRLLATNYGEIWDITSRQVIARLPVSMSGFVAFHPRRTDIVAISQDNAVLVIDLTQNAVFRRLQIEERCAQSIAFSSNGELLGIAGLTESEDASTGIVRLWEWEQERLVLEVNEPNALFYSVAMAPDAQLIAASGCFGPIGNSTSALLLWDREGRLKGKVEQENAAWNALTNCVCFSPDGTKLAFCGVDDRPCIATLTTEVVRTFGDFVCPSTPELIESGGVQEFGGYGSVVFSQDGLHLFAGGGGHHHDWGRFKKDRDVIEERISGGGDMSNFFTDIFSDLASSASLPDFFGLLGCWNISSGEPDATFEVSSTPIKCLAISADGRTLAAGSDLGLSLLWDISPLN
ncbi:MAG: hypothetical protein K8T91_15365 [Planctomycetes bacterium]|nr:hypothetical protein [Planctomycetota bacterium]